MGSTVHQQSKLIKYIEERPDVLTAITKKLDTKKHQTPSSHTTAQSATPYAVGSASRPFAGNNAYKPSAPIALRSIASAGDSGVVRSPNAGGITQTQTHLTHFSMQRRITVESPAPVPPFTSISSYASASATSSVASMASTNTVSTHSSRAALNAATATGAGTSIPVRNDRRRSRSGNAVLLNDFRDMSSNNSASVGPSAQPLKSVVSKASVQLRGIAPQCTGQYAGTGRTPFVAPTSSVAATKENVAPIHSGVSSSGAPASFHSGGYSKSVSAIPLPRQTSRYTVTVDESKGALRPI